MDEYIERAAAIKALGERPLNWDDKPDEVQAVWDYDLHRSAILSVRAADVAPVVHAEPVMIFDDPFTGRRFTTCSHCDGKIGKRDRYCKHCGAKMDGGKA